MLPSTIITDIEMAIRLSHLNRRSVHVLTGKRYCVLAKEAAAKVEMMENLLTYLLTEVSDPAHQKLISEVLQ